MTIKITLTFYTKYHEDEGLWYAHSSLTIMNGRGLTEDEAIENHILYFNTANDNSRYHEMASKIPGMIVKNFKLTIEYC